jgi:hypothetical protein
MRLYVQLVPNAPVARRYHVRVAVKDEADMTYEGFIQNLIDPLAVVLPPLW